MIRYYNDTIDKLQAQIYMRDDEIKILNKRLSDFAALGTAANAGGGVSLVTAGEEADLYPGESREIILDALCEYVKQIPTGSRRRDVLEDILSCNKSRGIPKQKAKLVKDALKGFTTLTSAIKQKLNDAGIDVAERPNKHYRLKYYGDDRYKATMSCSGGDKLRGGRNLASNIIQTMF